MKRAVALLVALVMMTVPLVACSSNSEPATQEIGVVEADNKETKVSTSNGEKVKIGVAFATEVAARFQFDEKFMRETAEILGADILFQWANYDQTKQENQVENLITQGIDVLILIGVSNNMSSLVEKVKNEGIPVVCYDNFIVDAPIDAYLDRDNEEAGRIQMRAAMEAADLAGKTFITGMDCEVAAMQAVYNGTIGIDIWTEIDKCAIQAVQIAHALARDEKFDYDEIVVNGNYEVPKLFVPIVGVTKDNLEDWVNNISPEGWITMDQILSAQQ